MSDALTRPKLGISSCLIGEAVRFDGGHKQNAYVMKTLAEHFQFVPFCPETAIGLSIPRNPIRLVAKPGDAELRAVEVRDPDKDYTDKLVNYGQEVAANQLTDFCGYVVKKDSPSCGMERVRVYERADAPAVRRGAGLYTSSLQRERPELPVEEEGRLMDPRLRESFITRVFTLHRWNEMKAAGLTRQSLVAFHTHHKFLILAHHEVTYRELGRLIADLRKDELESVAAQYLRLLMSGLSHVTSPGKNTNVLMHIMGFVKDRMTAEEKVELLDLIEAHRNGLVPVIVPITLLNHFFRRYPHDYVANQYFLEPNPRELMLRNNT